MQPTSLIFTRKALYTLKRRYGVYGDWYHIVSVTVDPANGISTVTKQKYRLPRVILLPVAMTQEINLAGGFRRVDTPLEGLPSQAVVVNARLLIVDGNDLPNDIDMTEEDYIIVQGNRYNIQKTSVLENNIGILVNARYVTGGIRNEWFDLAITEQVVITESAARVHSFGRNISESLSISEPLSVLEVP